MNEEVKDYLHSQRHNMKVLTFNFDRRKEVTDVTETN